MNYDMNLNKQSMLAALRRGDLLAERSCENWRDEEQEKLLWMFHNGIGISEIAMELQRSEMAIVQRLMDMKVLTSPQNRRSWGPRRKGCSCPGHCELDCPYYRDGGCYRVRAV